MKGLLQLFTPDLHVVLMFLFRWTALLATQPQSTTCWRLAIVWSALTRKAQCVSGICKLQVCSFGWCLSFPCEGTAGKRNCFALGEGSFSCYCNGLWVNLLWSRVVNNDFEQELIVLWWQRMLNPRAPEMLLLLSKHRKSSSASASRTVVSFIIDHHSSQTCFPKRGTVGWSCCCWTLLLFNVALQHLCLDGVTLVGDEQCEVTNDARLVRLPIVGVPSMSW